MFTEGFFSGRISNGKMDTEHAMDIVKKYESNPAFNMKLVINACEVDGISVNDLIACPQVAAFFNCFFVHLYKYNETFGSSSNVEANSQIEFSTYSVDVVESDTDVTDIEHSTNIEEFENETTAQIDEDVDNFEGDTTVANAEGENITNLADATDNEDVDVFPTVNSSSD